MLPEGYSGANNSIELPKSEIQQDTMMNIPITLHVTF